MAAQHLKATRKDYWKIGPVYVLKWIVLVLLAAGAAAVLAAFGLPSFGPLSDLPPAYRWDDERLGKVTGRVRVLDNAGTVRYEGTVAAGTYTGRGKVYDSAGDLVYDGPLEDGVYQGEDGKVYRDKTLVYTGSMAQNLYEGPGRRTDPVSGVVSEGTFSRGMLEGDGREYDAAGGLLRQGTFSRDKLEGTGEEYDGQGVLLREGAFSRGLLHGQGKEYTSEGRLWYEGEFQRGVRVGQGKLYDELTGALSYAGVFSLGRATGQGEIYHPSGQLLYQGMVYDGAPRADAFLGLSLADVEESFSEHWLLYTDGETTAFVYPYFHLMFVTDVPIKLVSAEPEASDGLDALAQAISEALATPEPATFEPAYAPDGSDEEPEASSTASQEPEAPSSSESAAPDPSAAPTDLGLDPETAKGDLVIREVLSVGQPLPGTARPQRELPDGSHPYGWREWFSAFAMGAGVKGAQAVQAGTFVWRFTPKSEFALDVDVYTAEGGGVLVAAVWGEGKEKPLFYESAVREDGS